MRSPDLIRYADISYRQLNYWTTRGYLVPAGGVLNPGQGKGQERNFSMEMARKAKFMSCLIKVGFEVSLAEKVAGFASQGETVIQIGHGVTIRLEAHEEPR